MNTLRIAYRLTKKRKWSLSLLTVEIIICSIVILSTLGKIFYYFETKDLAYSFDGKNIYYFSPYTYYDDFSAEELLSQKGFKNVEVCEMHELKIESKSDSAIAVIGYDDIIMKKLKLNIIEGQNISSYTGDNIPVIAMGNRFRVGDTIVLSDKQICEVVGKISEDSSVVRFNASASSGKSSIEEILATVRGCDLIMPYGPNCSYYNNSEIVKMDFPQDSQMIYCNGKKYQSAIKMLSDYGAITSVEQMQENYNKSNREFLFTNGIVGIVFLFLTMTGIGGINYIQSKNNDKFYTILFMLGMNKNKRMLIETLNTFSVIGISAITMLIFGGKIAAITSPKGVGRIENWMYIVVVINLCFIYAVSSFDFIKKSGKSNIIELYKKNKE